MVFVLLILVLWCRFSTPAADWYALHLYPGISRVLTWLASPFGFSLTEIVVVLAAVLLVVRIVRIFSDRQHWKKRLWRTVRLLLWVYVWFYAAWGLNYSRSSLYARMGAAPMPYEEAEFHAFLHRLTDELNENWCPESEMEAVDPAAYDEYVKHWYTKLPDEAGLCLPHKWQHPKRPLFNRLYSAVGVLGFLGPAFDEMHVNREVTPYERPFVHAHEFSHVLGVSGEAEANFWAFEATRASSLKAVRYSGWHMLLQYSWNGIRSLLDEQAFLEWTQTLRPEVLDDMEATQQYWQARRLPWIANLQKRFYDLFLRRNGIADGRKNYSQVLRMVLTFSDFDEEHGEEG